MNNYLKILIGSLLFGICSAYSMDQLTVIQIVGSSLIPIIVVIVLACIYQLIRMSMKLTKGFQDFSETVWKVFVPTIILMFIVTVLNIYSNPGKQKSMNNNDTYKGLVQQKNENEIKQVGKVDSEFLNEDNLYENFEYNFSIKFPSNYKVDYGIGKSSVVQAYDTTSGHIIAVSVSSSDFANISSDGYSDLQFAKKVVKDLFELYKTDEVRSKMTSGYEKRGFSDVTDNEPSLVNFNNIYFIKTNYKGYSILNNEEYPVILIDFVTANKQYGYHFIFKSWSESYTASWQSKIIEIMSNVHISKNITNVNS